MIDLAELLVGTDEDFLTNAYIAILGRWPDEAGFTSNLARIRGRPDERLPMLRRMTNSEEARARGLSADLSGPAVPAPAEQALPAQLRLRTEFLRAQIEALRDAAQPPAVPPGLIETAARTASALDALRAECRERLAALEAAHAADLPAMPAPPPQFADYLLDLLAASEARILERLRLLERRLGGTAG